MVDWLLYADQKIIKNNLCHKLLVNITILFAVNIGIAIEIIVSIILKNKSTNIYFFPFPAYLYVAFKFLKNPLLILLLFSSFFIQSSPIDSL